MTNYNSIINDLDEFQENIDEGGIITNVFLKKYNYPDEIKILLKDDFVIVRKIIDYYYNYFNKNMTIYNTFEECINNLIFLKQDSYNLQNNKIIKYIEFNNVIFKWLRDILFFEEIYDNNNDVDIEMVKEYKNSLNLTKLINDKFEPRINQQEAFDRLEKNGLETGIHCQATGCGKTFIILRYIDYCRKNIKNPKIILFTERVNILADLFGFDKENKMVPDINNINNWKKIGICDLTNFEIINRVTIKEKDWDELLVKSNKPTLLVINRAFLTLGKKYNKFSKNNLHLVLHDECHNTSSLQCHEFLLKCKEINVPIVGFSATPLRTGKNDKPKLLEIYGKEDSLNLLTNYNMIYAISNNLILPPEFYWYQIDDYVYKDNNDVSQEELGSVMELLNHLVLELPYKKIVAWCGTISRAKQWYELFKINHKQRVNLRDFKFGIDTSTSKNDDYLLFNKQPRNNDKVLLNDDLKNDDKRKMYYGKSILFCANKHREGSDIKYLDACIFLDKVKNRGSIPFIQSIGRVLRKGEIKDKGVVIDGIVKSVNYDKDFVDKIIGYYLALENLVNIVDVNNTKYDTYIKMRDIVKFDKENQLINLRLGNRDIRINCNKLKWDVIINKFDKILQDKIKLSVEDDFKYKSQILKKVFGFNKDTDFVKEYEKISKEDKIKYNLPDINDGNYSKLLNKKTWGEFLEFSDNFYNFNDFYIIVNKNIDRNNIKSSLKKINKMDNKIPRYPEYYYSDFSYTVFNNIKQIYI
jgi:hypothetical protein